MLVNTFWIMVIDPFNQNIFGIWLTFRFYNKTRNGFSIIYKPERRTYGAEISSHANERHNMVINFIRIWQTFGSNLWRYDS